MEDTQDTMKIIKSHVAALEEMGIDAVVIARCNGVQYRSSGSKADAEWLDDALENDDWAAQSSARPV